jgi:hypothetical protein
LRNSPNAQYHEITQTINFTPLMHWQQHCWEFQKDTHYLYPIAIICRTKLQCEMHGNLYRKLWMGCVKVGWLYAHDHVITHSLQGMYFSLQFDLVCNFFRFWLCW